MRRSTRIGLTLGIAMLAAVTLSPAQDGAGRAAAAIWVDGDIYDTIVTPTSFRNVPEGTTDVIYSFMMSGLMGQRSVAESAPDDPDYNGGRWDVHFAVYTAAGLDYFDPDGDGFTNLELVDDGEVQEHVDMGHITIMPANFYFVCPLLPRAD